MKVRLWWISLLVSTLMAGLLTAPADAAPSPGLMGNYDSAVVRGGTVTLTGWAFQLPFTGATVAIHVYDTSSKGTVGRVFSADRDRGDVNAAFGVRGRHGFSIDIPLEQDGVHRYCVYGVDVLTPQPLPSVFLGCREVMRYNEPFGYFDGPFSSTLHGRDLIIKGWGVDLDGPRTPLAVHVYDTDLATGQSVLTTSTSGVSRGDVAAAIPGAGPNQGFEVPLSISGNPGQHRICAYLINIGGGSNAGIGCFDVTYDLPPIGNYDSATTTEVGLIQIAGWALLPAEPEQQVRNDVTITSCCPNTFTAAQAAINIAYRPDVGAAFPGAGDYHGILGSFAQFPGDYVTCLRTVVQSRPSTELGCRRVTLPNFSGYIDSVTYSGGALTITGWAVNPYHPSDPTSAVMWLTNGAGQRLYDYGLLGGPFDTTLDRPDVNAALGVTGAHGFSHTFSTGFPWKAIPAGDYGVFIQPGGLPEGVRSGGFQFASASFRVN